MTKFLLVYIAVILGVATYFYLRREIREGRERRKERINAQPWVWYVIETHLDTKYLVGVFMSESDADEFAEECERHKKHPQIRYLVEGVRHSRYLKK